MLDKEIIPGYSNIIFKLNNFKKKGLTNLKKTERNAFFYSISNNYGIKSFLSENRTTSPTVRRSNKEHDLCGKVHCYSFL